MEAVIEFARAGGPVLGICNGFQVLCEAGLLPGALLPNRSLRFVCRQVDVVVENPDTPFTRACARDEVLSVPVKHTTGPLLRARRSRRSRSCCATRRATTRTAPQDDIAGVCNAAGNVLGLMPHPEHAVDPLTGSADGGRLFESLAMAPSAGVSGSAALAPHRELGLTDSEYDAICERLGREPNALELAVFSLMWSEHCAYKHSKKLLRELPTEGPHLLMGPGENAGVVDVGDGLAVAFKVESHNHPSAVEPFQGAATGVGGILRDIFAVGARPIAVLDSLRFGELDSPRSRYLFDCAVKGIGHYGNSIGVPTVGGEVVLRGGLRAELPGQRDVRGARAATSG